MLDDAVPRRSSCHHVSVIMTTFNSRQYVQTAVASLQAQTLTDWELVVIDDSSTDGTFENMVALAAADPRVRPGHSMQSSGTYVARNLALTLARGEFVALHDSDDVSPPDRLAKQVKAMQTNTSAVACTCNYERRDEAGRVVMNRGLRARLALGALMFRRVAVLDRIGFFDSVRTSADEEFRDRMLLAFGRRASVHIGETLYHALVRSGSLTTTGQGSSKLNISASSSVAAFLSPNRLENYDFFRAWHHQLKATPSVSSKASNTTTATALSPFMPFPLTRRRFPAPAALLPSPAAAVQQEVHAAVASIPDRQVLLAAVVAAILPQVDVLHVYLNGYDEIPAFLTGNSAIRVARSQDWGDVRDNGKFFFLSKAGSYYFALDDDLDYPADYVRALVLAIEKYGRRAVVGVHGVLLADPMTRFYTNCTVLGFRHALPADQVVHLLGTGTVAFHRDTLALTYDDFGEPGMADLWLAVAARRQGVPLRCVARAAGWLTDQDPGKKKTLYTDYKAHDEVQSRVAQKHGPWNVAALERANKVLARDLLDQFTPSALASRGVNASELAALALAQK